LQDFLQAESNTLPITQTTEETNTTTTNIK